MATLIFDLDGTLADTSGDLIAAANSRFRAMGLGDLLDPSHDAGIALRGGRAMLKAGFARVQGAFGEAEIDQQYQPLLEAYGQNIARYSRVYPGAMEAIAELKARGHKVGICTNKPEALADQLLRALRVRDEFGALVGADTMPTRKPDPAPMFEAVRRAGGEIGSACLIGDSDTDRDTALAANVPSILVTFGPSGEDMAALAPEALLDDYADLPALIDQMFGGAHG